MQEWDVFISQEIVIDTKSAYLFIGVLEEVNDIFVTLVNVDVHDHSEFSKTKEIYTLEAAKYGIKKNRDMVKVVRAEIICISLLENVIKY